MPLARPSMLLDHQARRVSEIDAINGMVPLLGRELGIPTPYNDTMTAVGRSAYGVVLQDAFIAEPSPGFLARHPDMAAVFAQDATEALSQDVAGRTTGLPLGDVQLLAPLSAHNKIICVGINYRKKYPLEGMPPPDPEHIIVFAKEHDAIVGHGEGLELPLGKAAESFDYEGEITLVIGKGGRHIAREAALSHVAGITIFNDGSVRGWQKHS
eukprot:gene2222-2926_t